MGFIVQQLAVPMLFACGFFLSFHSRLTVSDDEAVKVASGVVLYVQREEVQLYGGVWRTYQPGTLQVRSVAVRPSRRKEEARSVPRH